MLGQDPERGVTAVVVEGDDNHAVFKLIKIMSFNA